jgi:hypothetical protein
LLQRNACRYRCYLLLVMACSYCCAPGLQVLRMSRQEESANGSSSCSCAKHTHVLKAVRGRRACLHAATVVEAHTTWHVGVR